MTHKIPEAPICPYCDQPATLHKSSEALYHGRDYGPAWSCFCKAGGGAWVGCHPGTYNPLGRLANKELRASKIAAHAIFDQLWKGKMRRDGVNKYHARNAAYKWLGQQMGIPPKETHIGMMSVEQCKRVVEICQAIGKKEDA